MSLVVATLIWDPNEKSHSFSRIYDQSWVEKLFAGFRRNLTRPFRFVCFTDKQRDLPADIEQMPIQASVPDYSSCIEPYRLNEPMILVGLDTVVTGNIDHLADYCLNEHIIALPRDPFAPKRACNGVALVPAGMRNVFTGHRGENDMEWMRAQPHVLIDDLFPGQVNSYKGRVRQMGLGDTRICYFHGPEKPHELPHVSWIAEHWRV